jgi:leukotriene-A4 hydrolase
MLTDSILYCGVVCCVLCYAVLFCSVSNVAVSRYQGDAARFTQLVWPLCGEDPDEAFSRVPYEKGFNFLYHLEGLVGTEPFEAFAKQYLQEFKFSTVSSGEFKDFFLSKFAAVPAIQALDWDQFFYGQGMPPITVDFSNPLQTAAEDLAKQWIAADSSGSGSGSGSGSDSVSGSSSLAGWDSQQTCIFLGGLLEHAKTAQPLSLQTLRALDRAYDFTAVVNSEIKFCWQMLCLLSEDKDIVLHVVTFITSQGRMKFVRPLYKALFNSVVGSAIARETFITNSEMYHPICRKMLAADLGLDLANLKSSAKASATTAAGAGGGGAAAEMDSDDDDATSNNEESPNYLPMLASALAAAVIVAFVMKRR